MIPACISGCVGSTPVKALLRDLSMINYCGFTLAKYCSIEVSATAGKQAFMGLNMLRRLSPFMLFLLYSPSFNPFLSSPRTKDIFYSIFNAKVIFIKTFA
jgi:hypothetical protein